jgi:hypothetical protein
MWFLIRAAFWLSIVFAALPWPQGSGLRPSTPDAIWSGIRSSIAAALGKARAAGEKLCMDSPVACLKAAAQIEKFAPEGRADETRAGASAARRPAGAQTGEIGPPPAGAISVRAGAQHGPAPVQVKAALPPPSR